MAQLTPIELRSLIAEGESSTLELKVAPPRPHELAERMAALANAAGGLIIIGVSDDNVPVGVTDVKTTIDTLLRAARLVQPPIIFTPAEPEVYTLDGKKIVVATVPASTGAIYQAGGVFWIRTGTHSIPMTYQQIVELGHERGIVAWERLAAWNATLDDIDEEKVRAHLLRRSSRPQILSRLENTAEVLRELGCLTTGSDLTPRPTNAGILFFGHTPQAFVPQSEVVCVIFGDDVGVRRYIDRKIVTGTIQDIIDQAEVFIERQVAVAADIVGWKRIDVPRYSIESLREAMVNAIIHRDYNREGETVRIFIYPRRIEIRSPGALMPGLTIEMLQEGLASSRLRNPILGGLLRDVPGYFERIGSGVRFMLEETERRGLPQPTFRDVGGEIIVTFAEEVAEPPPQEEITAPLSEQEALINARRTRQEQAMRYIHQHGSITSPEYIALTDATERTVQRDLDYMVKAGIVRRVGKTRGSRYELMS